MTTAIQQQTQQQPTTLAQFLEVRKRHLADVLPKHLTPDRLVKLAVLATRRVPKLAECGMDSIFTALMQCAELGLEPSGTLGGAYLVPYKGTCQLIIGYRGLIDLARRSGVLEQIEAHVVHEKDVFEVEFGMTPKLRHVPTLREEPGNPVLVYMVARLKGGGIHTEVMTVPQVEAVRSRSMSARNGPWVSDWAEMAKKTVVRRGCKYLPLSPELVRAFELEEADTHHDDGAQALHAVTGEVVQEPQHQTQTARVKDAVRALPKRSTIIDVKPGETDEQAEARVMAESSEPPPPSDADAPPMA